jgi:hypothetical protein
VIGGVTAKAGFGEIGSELGSTRKGGRGVGFEGDFGKVVIEVRWWKASEDRFAWGARIHGNLQTDGAADFDGLGGDALLDDGDFVIDGSEELGGLAGGVTQPFEGVEGAEDEAFFAHLRPGEVEQFVGEDKAFVVLAALEVAALLQSGGDARDGVDGEVELASDLGEVLAEAMLAEPFEDGEGAFGAWGGRVVAQGDCGGGRWGGFGHC